LLNSALRGRRQRTVRELVRLDVMNDSTSSAPGRQTVDGTPRTLGERIGDDRLRFFVGREAERALFRSALEQDRGDWSVLYVHGPGGIGKTTLLKILATDARASGRLVVEVDLRTSAATPQAFEAELGARALATEGLVLVIDTFERAQALESWLRNRLIPRLPSDALVVVAGRLPPDPSWRADPGWNDALRVIGLPDLGAGEARSLLAGRGVPEALRDEVLTFAGGQPLALTLAADLAARPAARPGGWAPDRDVVKTLLSRLIGTVPSPRHRRALEVCAQTEVTTEDLLRATVGADAAELFEWLCTQPFVESGRYGAYPHDVVRDLLVRDLRWRDPDGYAELHRLVREHLVDRVRQAPEAGVIEAGRSLMFLYRNVTSLAGYVTWVERGEVYEDVLRPEDRATVLRLTAESETAESVRIAQYWLDRQPGAFRVHRRADDDEMVAFGAWLTLDKPDPDDLAADPTVAALWRHAETHGQVRDGEHLVLHRFSIDPVAYGGVSPVVDLFVIRSVAEWMRSDGLAWSCHVSQNAELWGPQMASIDHDPLSAPVVVGDRPLTLYVHDWRAHPAREWLDRQDIEVFSGRRPPPIGEPAQSVLPRDSFDAAVRKALRDFDDAALLQANDLCGTALAHDGAALRQVLTEALGELAENPRADKLHRAVNTTYFRRVPTQEAAAERLGLPFSTYRRHLTAGVKGLCDVLWGLELSRRW
jgi:hypothetical protein